MQGRPGGIPEQAADVRSPATVGFSLVEPRDLPRSAWASDYLPRFSQQVALGGLLNGRSPVKSVNGPPGTGKTTLLRDVYADVVAERASVMVEYDDPRSAFGAATRVPGSDGRTWTVRLVDKRLTGFEMLVASSNNAAVQNVSHELPALEQVGEAYRDKLSLLPYGDPTRSGSSPDPNNAADNPR